MLVGMKNGRGGTVGQTSKSFRSVGTLTEAIVEQLRIKRRTAFKNRTAALLEKPAPAPRRGLRGGDGSAKGIPSPAPIDAAREVFRRVKGRVAKRAGRGAEKVEK